MGRSLRVVLAALIGSVAVWAADPAVGTWVLNIAKSKYVPGPVPRSQIRIYEQHGDDLKATVKTVSANGKSVTAEFPANYDSKEHSVTGSPDTDAIIMHKLDDFTSESTLMHAGVVVGTARRVISKDGKTMTITFEGTLEGDKVKNLGVYDKK